MILLDIITLFQSTLGKSMYLLLYIVIATFKAVSFTLRSLINIIYRIVKLSLFLITIIFKVIFIALIKGIPFILIYIFQFCLDIFVLSIKFVCKLVKGYIYILSFILNKINYFYNKIDFYRTLLNNIMHNSLIRKTLIIKLRLTFLHYKNFFITYSNLSTKNIINKSLKTFFTTIEIFTIKSEKNVLTLLRNVGLFVFKSFTFIINLILLMLLILKALYGVMLSLLSFTTYKNAFVVICKAKIIIVTEIIQDLKLMFKFIFTLPKNIVTGLKNVVSLLEKIIVSLFNWSKKHYLKASFIIVIFTVCLSNTIIAFKNSKLFLNAINQYDNKVSIANVVCLLVNFCTGIKNNLDIKYKKIVLNVKNYKSLNQELLKINIHHDEANNIFKAINSITNTNTTTLNGEIYATLVTSKQKDGVIKVSQLEIPLNNSYNLIVESTENSAYTAYTQKKKLIKYFVKQSFVINDNYYISANNSQIPSNVVNTLSKILSWHIDFQRDINPGNQVEVLYQTTSDIKHMINSNKLIYAAIKLNHKTLNFYNYDGEFYLQNGRSASMALLRTPVEGYRISSPFGKRSHPILGYSIFHKGVDFAAPTGTPIPASGNGVVKRVNISPTFGKVIEIQHNAYLSTLYAHLNAFARDMKVGKVVYQRDIIGYIGSTGRATGPHLHYEVHFNGQPVNPVNVKLPSSSYLSGESLDNFNNYRDEIKQILLKIPSNQKISISFNEI